MQGYHTRYAITHAHRHTCLKSLIYAYYHMSKTDLNLSR